MFHIDNLTHGKSKNKEGGGFEYVVKIKYYYTTPVQI